MESRDSPAIPTSSDGLTSFSLSLSLSLFSFSAKDDQKDSPTELAFKYAVYRINKADDVLPNNTLAYDIQYVPAEDSFRTTRKVRLVSFSTAANPRRSMLIHFF